MKQTRTKEIGGRVFVVTQLGVAQALPTFARVAKLVGPALARIVSARGTAEQVLAAGAIEALRGLDPAELVGLAEVFASSTKVRVKVLTEGASHVDVDLDLEQHFAGKMRDLLSWLAFAVEVNFADFFDEARAALSSVGIRPKGAPESPSPNTSANDGPSTGSRRRAASKTA